MALVTLATNVRCIFLIRNNRTLWRQRVFGLKQGINSTLNDLCTLMVFGFQLGIGVRDRDKGDNLDNLEEMVKGDDGFLHN